MLVLSETAKQDVLIWLEEGVVFNCQTDSRLMTAALQVLLLALGASCARFEPGVCINPLCADHGCAGPEETSSFTSVVHYFECACRPDCVHA